MERRRAQRWIQEEEVVCYFQGDRLGAFSKDLSTTGMYLGTTREVPIGGRVALIFRPQSVLANPIYLVGKVVRHQTKPVPGLGLLWIKAITDGSPLQLSNFLKSMLELDARDAIDEMAYETGAVSSYTFPGPPQPEQKTSKKKKKSALELLDMLNVEVVHSDEYQQRRGGAEKPPPKPKPPRKEPAVSGPITRRVDNQKVYAPCRIPGTLVILGVQREISIRGLATWGLFVETEAVPPVGTEVGLIFDLKTKSGDARLVLRCDVESHKQAKEGWAAGLDLTITNPGDPLGTALLKRYVRWLHFRAVADD